MSLCTTGGGCSFFPSRDISALQRGLQRLVLPSFLPSSGLECMTVRCLLLGPAWTIGGDCLCLFVWLAWWPPLGHFFHVTHKHTPAEKEKVKYWFMLRWNQVWNNSIPLGLNWFTPPSRVCFAYRKSSKSNIVVRRLYATDNQTKNKVWRTTEVVIWFSMRFVACDARRMLVRHSPLLTNSKLRRN